MIQTTRIYAFGSTTYKIILKIRLHNFYYALNSVGTFKRSTSQVVLQRPPFQNTVSPNPPLHINLLPFNKKKKLLGKSINSIQKLLKKKIPKQTI